MLSFALSCSRFEAGIELKLFCKFSLFTINYDKSWHDHHNRGQNDLLTIGSCSASRTPPQRFYYTTTMIVKIVIIVVVVLLVPRMAIFNILIIIKRLAAFEFAGSDSVNKTRKDEEAAQSFVFYHHNHRYDHHNHNHNHCNHMIIISLINLIN